MDATEAEPEVNFDDAIEAALATAAGHAMYRIPVALHCPAVERWRAQAQAEARATLREQIEARMQVKASPEWGRERDQIATTLTPAVRAFPGYAALALLGGAVSSYVKVAYPIFGSL